MDLSSLQHQEYSLLLLFFLLLQLCCLFLFHCQTKSSSQRISLLGLLPQYLKNRHRILEWITEVLAARPTLTIVFRSPGKKTEVMTANPDNIEHALKSNFANYPKGETTLSTLSDLVGQSIFACNGELWRSQRKTAGHEFNAKSLRKFVANTVQIEIEHRLLPLLRRASSNEEVVDLQDTLERFAFDNICKVAFGVDPMALRAGDHRGSEKAYEVPVGFMEAFDESQKSMAARFFEPLSIIWKVKRLLDIGSERRLRLSTKIVHDFATTIVRSRMANDTETDAQHEDLLSRFISAMGADCREEFLRDVIVGFMLAGRDTTSSSLTWFFWILSSRPDVRANILDEIRSVRAARGRCVDGGCFGFDELKEMHYLHAAITESLRLFPALPVDTVSCESDDVLPDGTFVRKGWFVSYVAYSVGRMEKVWGKDCCEYKPERWLENGAFRSESPYKFPVFHAGPRMCLGKEMAYIQMKSIVASVVERFEVEVERRDGDGESLNTTTPGYLLSLTLRMKGGLPVRLRENV